ncbi:NAD(P)-dependent oxidoreductase [Streptococcus orisratti]|nr:NAD(P)-dependent oxidoreductase [Streptococcus orisratti]
MKIAVVAVNGKAGQAIVEEALKRGLDVTAIVRSKNKSKANKVIEKDLFDLTKEDLSDFDVVVDAFGAWSEDQLHLHSVSQKHLADLLSGTEKRLMIVGGAGSLYINPEHTVQLVDTPEFPEIFKPLANAQRQTLAEIRERKDVKWTFVSPAADFQADGQRSGHYILAGEEFTVNDNGQSTISYADYAIGFVDEIENGRHIQERISLIGK